MATGPMGTGATAQRVAGNLRRLREARGYSLRELSELLMEKAGWKLSADAINKIENGRELEPGTPEPKQIRRVDVDDLLALAVALNVSPLTLLLPPHAGDAEVELAPTKSVTSSTAWAWGAAQQTAIDHTTEPTLDLGDGTVVYTEAGYEDRQKFYREQEAFLALAQPEEIRQELSRGEGHRAVRIARDLVDAIRSLVAPEFTVGAADVHATLQARRNRGVRRLYAALGLELDEIEEHLPPPPGSGKD